jgi:hypothetical protein
MITFFTLADSGQGTVDVDYAASEAKLRILPCLALLAMVVFANIRPAFAQQTTLFGLLEGLKSIIPGRVSSFQ